MADFIITDEFIEAIKSKSGGYTPKQLAAMGVSLPLSRGWKAGVIGKVISEDVARSLLLNALHKRRK